MRGIENRRVLITGGCGDIGKAVAARFLAAGASVVIADKVADAAGTEVASRLHAERARFQRCDVTQKDSVSDAVEFAFEWMGGLDVAISNAGAVANAPLLSVTLEDWQRILDINLTGSFLFAQKSAQAMLRTARAENAHRGSILFTGSWVQDMPWPQGAGYCSSKGGQEMLMKVAAQELAAEGITCNIVAPGFVYAGLTKRIYDSDEQFRHRADNAIPLHRLSTADEVAGAFLFLASEDGAYITGTTLLVDGGASLVKRSE